MIGEKPILNCLGLAFSIALFFADKGIVPFQWGKSGGDGKKEGESYRSNVEKARQTVSK